MYNYHGRGYACDDVTTIVNGELVTNNDCGGAARGPTGPFALERHQGPTGGCSNGPAHGPNTDMHYWTSPRFFADRNGIERINIRGDYYSL